MKHRSEGGMALATTMLVLLLLSTMIAGFAWMVMGDRTLGGNYADRQLAFYGAEAGVETLTASVENLFNGNYAPTAAMITGTTGLVHTAPTGLVPGVSYLNPDGTNGFVIKFPTQSNGNPQASAGNIPNGTYAGMVGLITPYTVQVTARTNAGSEVRMQRVVQTVAIPLFQFGMFSQTDLAFFAGPDFDFGGRVQTNGNLWLAEGTGGTLTMGDKVSAAGEIITQNLENGWLTSSNYTGTVDITTGSGAQNLITQSPNQSVQGNSNSYGSIGAYKTTFAAMASSVYNNNIGVSQTGAKALNLSIATPSIGGQTIDLIRRPQPSENTTNSAKLAERYYSQVSLQILLSDYGPSGACSDSDISSTSSTALPNLAPNGTTPTTPVDLATLSWDTNDAAGNANNGSNPPPYKAAPSWLTGTFPLPVSYAASNNTYSSTNGYWIKEYYPIITGCIKIAYQSSASPGTWVDVTGEILKLGYTGRNINPQSTNTAPPTLPSLPTSQQSASGPTANGSVSTVGCADPSADSVIRLARVRDNPSFWSSSNHCGGTASQHGADYWPNVLYDTREALQRDNALGGTQLPLVGSMYYIELDVADLAKWFTGTIGTSGTQVLATTGYSIYFSDRRGEVKDTSPPASVSTTPALTGGFGYEDIVNPSSSSGCKNGILDQGEDVEGDYVNGVDSNPILRTYGGVPTFDNVASSTIVVPITTTAAVLSNNPNCTAPGTSWPYAIASHVQDLRENPPLLFRGALKVVHGDTISLGTCNGVACGLTIVSENPVYVQGCYNNPGQCGMTSVSWSSSSVGSAVIADAVTLLSDNWNDVNSFAWPYGMNSSGYNISNGGRDAGSSTYRMAVLAGKGVPFPQPSGTAQDFGTDGGAHNFLRYLENWNGTAYYEGSIASMYYNHQAVGSYKCCNTVYGAPTRGYEFDSNFLTPSLLPPLTPMLRDINTIGYTQLMLPTQ